MSKTIDIGSPTWIAVQEWAERGLAELRDFREIPNLDVRKLDLALGSIEIFKKLLALPEAIRRDRVREPVMDDTFDIPPISDGVNHGSSSQ